MEDEVSCGSVWGRARWRGGFEREAREQQLTVVLELQRCHGPYAACSRTTMDRDRQACHPDSGAYRRCVFRSLTAP